MILYSLACEEGHRFQSWFRDSAAYDDQASRALVSCPTCQSTRVAKTIMAPSIVGARRSDVSENTEGRLEEHRDRDRNAADEANASSEGRAGDNDRPDKRTDVALLDPRRREIAALLKTIRDKVVAEGHDVGERFPQEARRIHDGEAPVRRIYGKASLAETMELLEDGIMVVPLPVLPDDLN